MPRIPHADYTDTVSGYWDWETDSREINVDDSLKILLDLPEIDNDLASWKEIIKPGYLDILRENYIAHRDSQGKIPFTLEIALQHKDRNKIVCILVTGRLIWNGEVPLRMTGSYFDISPHKQAEKELQRVKDFLNKTNQTARVGGWELDLETGRVIWTEVTKMIFEVPEDYVPDRGSAATFFKEGADRKKLGDAFNKAVNKGVDYDLELQIVTAKGKTRWTRTVGHPEFQDGKCIRLYGVFQDIDERKKQEEEIRLRQQQADDATNAKIEFLSIVSHEIRTPMNAIVGFTNLLLDNPRPDQVEYLNVLRFSADNLLTLINDILDFNKIDAGKVVFENIDFDLHALLENIRAAQQQEADKKEILLTLEIGPGVPARIKGDPTRLSQVLNNLVANAIKFTPAGKVELSTSVTEKTATTATLCFAVKDTGIGIPEDKLQYIFEKFSQASSETTRKYGGTGLGLAICKRLLELVGSKLSVISKEDEGSSFFFELRFNIDEKTAAESLLNAAADNSGFPGKRVLVTEDNPVNAMLVRRFLTNWQIECDVAENGRIGVDKVASGNYDLVLMDLQMPVMDGYEATIAIRNLPGKKYKELPILALTASTVSDMYEKVIASGMNACLTKPFKPAQLHEMLAYYFNDQR
ncbi:hybrid sensor histidine kinase/response regulator [Hufsiella ginkgonis]|uniref:histidine kinase n=1 Tax=Hufsiella ginkgonis TaxID=2695274 RepID=A0A7K1XSP1_9SPHI|nr:PAS domain-containing hybrid sensor histidine kinase/response regulator [Hufsiella ginkgonis]MXV14021.1 response regulator [Hufsiella ginkgonis]